MLGKHGGGKQRPLPKCKNEKPNSLVGGTKVRAESLCIFEICLITFRLDQMVVIVESLPAGGPRAFVKQSMKTWPYRRCVQEPADLLHGSHD